MIKINYTTDYQSERYAPDTVHETNSSGYLEILGKVEPARRPTYAVVFPSTGFVTTATSSDIKAGKVKDYFLPTVYGRGFMGVPRKGEGVHTKREYALWISMLGRCYSGRYPNYSDVEVSPEWFNFQQFRRDIKTLKGYDIWLTGGKYQLDKDTLSDKRLYSKDTCMFVSPSENITEMRSRDSEGRGVRSAGEVAFRAPTGEVYVTDNLARFCAEHSLHHGHMCHVKLGKRKSHKGWRLYLAPAV